METVGRAPRFTIHDRLRKAREEAHLSQTELAETIGISRQSVSNHETGATTHIKRIVLNQWALACGVPLDWLRESPKDGPDRPRSQSRCIGRVAA